MTGNRIAFVSAIGFAVLALFMLSGAEAVPNLHTPFQSPQAQDDRVNAIEPMIYGITYSDSSDEWGFPDSLYVEFEGGTAGSIALVCSHVDCDGGGIDPDDPNGFWAIDSGSEPDASTLVTNLGTEVIRYQFVATKDGQDDLCHPSPCNVFQTNNTRVNTLPELADDASVTGGGMPEDEYTLTITYTDLDNHAGTVTATVCETATPTNCDESVLSLSKTSGDEDTGAVYSVAFYTELGGSLTVTVSAEDDYDPASTDDRTKTFVVDTTTPWLKDIGDYNATGGETEDFTFTVVYCVFDDTTQGTPSVNVDVNGTTHSMSEGGDNEACTHGKNYTKTTTIAWAGLNAQAVTFSGSNDNGAAQSLSGQSITINDAPTL
ncbi:MAG: hypothetical protein VX898_02340, partial [Candidatus Thermoplasmatota archaeon]|nr:hypothetical protein [Candidatus Thermoplasmatota archaeon]